MPSTPERDFRSTLTAAALLAAGDEAAAGLLAWLWADADDAGGLAAVLLLELEPLEQALAASAMPAAQAAAAIQFLIMMLPRYDSGRGALPSSTPPVTLRSPTAQ
jgi:hypothetical protein